MAEKMFVRPDQVRARYCVSDMTLRRWERNADIGFPAPIRINGRRFWDSAELSDFDARMAAERSPRGDKAA